MRLLIFIFLTFLVSLVEAYAQTTERRRPAEWSNLVYGGRFLRMVEKQVTQGELAGMSLVLL